MITYIQAYADDFILIVVDTTRDKVYQKASEALKELESDSYVDILP